jgi:two-component system nitrate/nitrite response regulator NarL
MTDGDGGGRRWRVLVVDDEDDLRALVRLTLEFEDELAVVATAGGAGEAVRMAAEMAPDLVVLDQMLGGPLTGLDVAAQLRALHPGTRVIIFSAADDVIDLRDPRVDAVLPKMEIGQLPATVRRVLAATSA